VIAHQRADDDAGTRRAGLVECAQDVVVAVRDDDDVVLGAGSFGCGQESGTDRLGGPCVVGGVEWQDQRDDGPRRGRRCSGGVGGRLGGRRFGDRDRCRNGRRVACCRCLRGAECGGRREADPGERACGAKREGTAGQRGMHWAIAERRNRPHRQERTPRSARMSEHYMWSRHRSGICAT